MQSFFEFAIELDRYDEAFWDEFKKSYRTSYGNAANFVSAEQDYAKFKNIVVPAISKAKNAAQALSAKTGISLPLAVTLIASGIAGGPAAVPMAVVMYFTRRAVMNPVLKGASNLYDKFVPPANQPIPTQPSVQPNIQPIRSAQPVQPTQSTQYRQPNPWVYSYNTLSPQHESLDEGFRDWLGRTIGGASGYLVGKGSKYTRVVKNVLKGGMKDLKNFVSQNKVGLGKAAFLVGVGALIGSGVGWASSKALHGVTDVLAQHPEIPPSEVSQIDKQIVNQFHQDLPSWQEPSPGMSGDVPPGTHTFYNNGSQTYTADAAKDFGQTPDDLQTYKPELDKYTPLEPESPGIESGMPVKPTFDEPTIGNQTPSDHLKQLQALHQTEPHTAGGEDIGMSKHEYLAEKDRLVRQFKMAHNYSHVHPGYRPVVDAAANKWASHQLAHKILSTPSTVATPYSVLANR